jgi:hypothetical protein
MLAESDPAMSQKIWTLKMVELQHWGASQGAIYSSSTCGLQDNPPNGIIGLQAVDLRQTFDTRGLRWVDQLLADFADSLISRHSFPLSKSQAQSIILILGCLSSPCPPQPTSEFLCFRCGRGRNIQGTQQYKCLPLPRIVKLLPQVDKFTIGLRSCTLALLGGEIQRYVGATFSPNFSIFQNIIPRQIKAVYLSSAESSWHIIVHI